MKLNKTASKLSPLLMVFLLSACLGGSNSSSGTSTSKYNNLVEEYNKLLAAGNDNANASLSLSTHVMIFDQNVSKLKENLDNLNSRLQSMSENKLSSTEIIELRSVWDSFVKKEDSSNQFFNQAIEEVLLMEANLIKNKKSALEFSEFKKSQSLHDQYVRTSFSDFESQGLHLAGIKALLLDYYNFKISELNALMKDAFAVARVKDPSAMSADLTPSIVTSKKVEITDTEQAVATLSTTQNNVAGFRVRNGQRQVFSGDPREIYNAANEMGINSLGVDDAIKMSQTWGSVVGLAASPKDLGLTIENIMANIKQSLNQNGGNLDLVFAIDYSGSMNDDIQAVIESLVSLVKNLEVVNKAGRKYNIGIVTFGVPNREKINLELTENLASVSSTLEALFQNYSADQHSTDPGEASYHGLNLVADKMNWKSSNRKIILITDEPSYELQTKREDFVNEVIRKLKVTGVSTTVYPILVTNWR